MEKLQWLILGSDFPDVHHGGRRKVREIDINKLQHRDHGFYGKGFYVTTAPHYAKTYGPVISRYRFNPKAVILRAGMLPSQAPPGLQDVVVVHIDQKYREAARVRGKEAAFDRELAMITEPLSLEWRKAVTDYAVDLGVDAIAFSDGEIVVSNPTALSFIK